MSAIIRDFSVNWKKLVLTDIFFKAIAFVVLTPLVGLLFRASLTVSGNAVLADQDILFFLLGPMGWISFILVGAVALAIIALEQAALLSVLGASGQQREMGITGALWFAAKNAWPVLRVTGRMAALTLLMLAPFLLVGALVYSSLLTEFDINYYLKEQPPVFQRCAGVKSVWTSN
jgi:glycerophosphoryl diester phosphodiesterase